VTVKNNEYFVITAIVEVDGLCFLKRDPQLEVANVVHDVNRRGPTFRFLSVSPSRYHHGVVRVSHHTAARGKKSPPQDGVIPEVPQMRAEYRPLRNPMVLQLPVRQVVPKNPPKIGRDIVLLECLPYPISGQSVKSVGDVERRLYRHPAFPHGGVH